MTDNTDSMDVLDYEPKANPETGRELLPNPERGCGYLEESKAYIRTDPVRSTDGAIPAFVTFDPPIPYKEGTLRSYQQFDGLGFQRSLKDDFSTIPEDDLSDLWDRYENSEDGEHWGGITTAYSQDLLMWVGETYYDDPRDFVEESRRFGLNKAIPVSKRQEPPAINPMKTRVFCTHPTAYRVYEQPVMTENDDGDMVPVEDDDGDVKIEKVRVSYREDDNRLGTEDADDPVKTIAGVVGYSYLTRVVWTAPSDGDIPKWAKQYEDTGQLDIVDVGEQVPEDEVSERLPTADDDGVDDKFKDPEFRRQVDRVMTSPDTEELDMEAETVQPSDKPGRDVEAVRDDEDAHPDAVDAYQAWVDELGRDPDRDDFRGELPDGYHELRNICSRLGLSPGGQNPGKTELVDALVEQRVFRGTVGDDQLYYVDDGVPKRVPGENENVAANQNE